jgi:hypothetical protein
VFVPAGGTPRGGVAIGDEILDLSAGLELGLFEGVAREAAGDPDPLPYLLDASDQAAGALDIDLEVWLLTESLASKGLPRHRNANRSRGRLDLAAQHPRALTPGQPSTPYGR